MAVTETCGTLFFMGSTFSQALKMRSLTRLAVMLAAAWGPLHVVSLLRLVWTSSGLVVTGAKGELSEK